MKIAIIHWTDSALHGVENYKADDPELKPIKGVSIGIVVKNTKEAITLAIDAWETGYYRNTETILKRQIDHIEIKDLKLNQTIN